MRKISGDAPSWVQLQALGGNLAYSTASRSMGNPAESANAGMLSVGAAHYWDTNTIASYSSQGPTPGGTTKPDITGAAGAQVSAGSVTAGFSGPQGQQCWFAGTSQSAPHVAGLAALVKERFPDYTPAQIATYLKTNALDRGAANPNNIWGEGFAKLPALPTPTPTLTPTPTPTPTITSTPTITLTPTPSPTITLTPTP